MDRVFDDLYWDEDEEFYVVEDIGIASGNFYLPVVEKSLREQGFKDQSVSYGSYETVLNQGNDIQARIDAGVMELDFYGTRLSGLKEDPELLHALQTGHLEGTSSLERLLEAEENPTYSRLDEL